MPISGPCRNAYSAVSQDVYILVRSNIRSLHAKSDSPATVLFHSKLFQLFFRCPKLNTLSNEWLELSHVHVLGNFFYQADLTQEH